MRAAVLSIAAFAIGCAPLPSYLRWQDVPPAPSLSGAAQVQVVDRRELPPNVSDPGTIGVERVSTPSGPYAHASGFMDEHVRVDPAEIAWAIDRLVAQAAQAGGVRIVGPQERGATARIVVEVHRLWCEFGASEITALVLAVDARDGRVLDRGKWLTAQSGQRHLLPMSSMPTWCRTSTSDALDQLLGFVRQWLDTPALRAALLAAPPATPR